MWKKFPYVMSLEIFFGNYMELRNVKRPLWQILQQVFFRLVLPAPSRGMDLKDVFVEFMTFISFILAVGVIWHVAIYFMTEFMARWMVQK